MKTNNKLKEELDKMQAERSKIYSEWENTWSTYSQNPKAFEQAKNKLLEYDIKLSNLWEEYDE